MRTHGICINFAIIATLFIATLLATGCDQVEQHPVASGQGIALAPDSKVVALNLVSGTVEEVPEIAANKSPVLLQSDEFDAIIRTETPEPHEMVLDSPSTNPTPWAIYCAARDACVASINESGQPLQVDRVTESRFTDDVSGREYCSGTLSYSGDSIQGQTIMNQGYYVFPAPGGDIFYIHVTIKDTGGDTAIVWANIANYLVANGWQLVVDLGGGGQYAVELGH